jgi:hypothetical protein
MFHTLTNIFQSILVLSVKAKVHQVTFHRHVFPTKMLMLLHCACCISSPSHSPRYRNAWTGPGGFRWLRLPEFLECGKVVSPTYRPPLPSKEILSRPQGERIKSMKNPNDPIGNRTRDLPACSAVRPTAPTRASVTVYAYTVLFTS